ncbi:hypothetical protein C4D60_Mb09t25190 [Musa balbisiana]|uniref:UBC core domain-containing protein n=1 Tax=Musa balbisiana TaxID=52838 RepID=A0A4S8IJQ2_MUSBA|nr:hypothetical protein C4D60_Mb09t25190 [Musa balbisiana]
MGSLFSSGGDSSPGCSMGGAPSSSLHTGWVERARPDPSDDQVKILLLYPTHHRHSMSRLRFSIRGPAEAHLRQAVRGRPHPGRLQHPEGGGGLLLDVVVSPDDRLVHSDSICLDIILKEQWSPALTISKRKEWLMEWHSDESVGFIRKGRDGVTASQDHGKLCREVQFDGVNGDSS